MQMRVRDRDCPVQVGRRDHIVEATLIGTAIARFSPAAQPGAGPPLAIMSLDPQRRQGGPPRARMLRWASTSLYEARPWSRPVIGKPLTSA
jgi:hypothetical protein